MTAQSLLRAWLRVWAAVFALGAVDFLLFPQRTVATLDAAGARFGLAHPSGLETPGYWVPLAAAYMVLITAFCWDAQAADPVRRRPVAYLLVAKVSSSLFALGYFLAGGLAFAFLVAGLIDAAIAAGTFWLLRAARVEPA